MGYVDPLGRFIRDPDVDSLDNRKTTSNPIQFLTNLVRNDQDELVSKIPSYFLYLTIFSSGNGRSRCSIC